MNQLTVETSRTDAVKIAGALPDSGNICRTHMSVGPIVDPEFRVSSQYGSIIGNGGPDSHFLSVVRFTAQKFLLPIQ